MTIEEKLRLLMTVVPEQNLSVCKHADTITIVRKCGCRYIDRMFANGNNQIALELCPRHNDLRLLKSKFHVGQKVRYTDEAIEEARVAFNIHDLSANAMREKHIVQSIEVDPDCDHLVVIIQHPAENEPKEVAEINLCNPK